MHRFMLAVLIVGSLAACASQPSPKTQASTGDITLHVNASGEPVMSPEEQEVQKGLEMIQAGQIMAAVDGPLTDVVKKFEAEYASSDAQIYSARGMTDALLYAGLGTTNGGHRKVDVLGPAWAMAYWARGYAYGEMARYDDERIELDKALALAPLDAQYNNELAFTYSQMHEWEKALALYQRAEENAELTTTDVPHSQCASLRGQGYVLVELHRLDEAEAKYKACLKITPDEPKSLAEIDYIQTLRKKPR
ncbi:tetratricopeptide repeat protein [Dyella sp. 20L07]|uniref:tetratricopeptide repeat protein n=1 Tax=Dyella sp. 20L07 TaxID=3384240 RepID=UPI003D2BE46F